MPKTSPIFGAAVPAWYGRVRADLRRFARPVLAQQSGRGLFSFTTDIPPEAVSQQLRSGRPSVFWSRPADNHSMLALGEALRKQRGGEERFQQLAQDYQTLLDNWTHITRGQADSQARAFMGYGFDAAEEPEGIWEGFPNSLLYVPAVLVEWKDGHCSLSFTCHGREKFAADSIIANWLKLLESLIQKDVTADQPALNWLERVAAEPAPEEWLQQVEKAKSDIRHGVLDKVVLGRRVRLRGQRRFNIQRLFRELAERYPGCSVMAVTLGRRTLVAATPERLVAQHGRCVTSDAMAGTLRQGEELSSATMLRLEHVPVVQAIHRALTPFCESMEVPESPSRLTLRSLEHLWTPVRGRLKPGVQIFDMIRELHPTPAVGGVPWHTASRWIAQNDYSNRGWYTGGFGWLSSMNEGEFAVLLRCALLRGNEADLFAGAGITAGSDPAQELRETELKLAAMQDTLAIC